MVSATTYLLKSLESLCSTLTTFPTLCIQLSTKASLSGYPRKSQHTKPLMISSPNCPFFMDFLISVNVKTNHPIA